MYVEKYKNPPRKKRKQWMGVDMISSKVNKRNTSWTKRELGNIEWRSNILNGTPYSTMEIIHCIWWINEKSWLSIVLIETWLYWIVESKWPHCIQVWKNHSHKTYCVYVYYEKEPTHTIRNHRINEWRWIWSLQKPNKFNRKYFYTKKELSII
jgi:hypothetical protein